MSAMLKWITSIAKGLTKAELHVLIELASRLDAEGGLTAMASSRDLAGRTGLARASVQTAIDSLNRKGFLYSDSGAATRPAAHRLMFLELVENVVSGPTVEPQVAQKLGQGGLTAKPIVAQIPGQGGPGVRPLVAQSLSPSGPNSEPQPNEKSNIYEQPYKERGGVRADSIESNFDKVIDQLQRSQKSDFDEEIFELARNRIASHHAKFAREANRLSALPDDKITAQFLAIAEWPKLEALLFDLASERKEAGYSYGWYITVALQRIHGIPPSRLQEMREQLNHSRKGAQSVGRPVPQMQAPRRSIVNGRPIDRNPVFEVEQLKQQLRDMAAAKGMP
jgi:hypothetical protein